MNVRPNPYLSQDSEAAPTRKNPYLSQASSRGRKQRVQIQQVNEAMPESSNRQQRNGDRVKSRPVPSRINQLVHGESAAPQYANETSTSTKNNKRDNPYPDADHKAKKTKTEFDQSVKEGTYPLPIRTETFVPVETGPDVEMEPKVKSKFMGRNRRNYQRFLKYIEQQDFNDADFTTLGTLSDDNFYYFVQSDACRNNARNFLDEFWKDERNRNLTLERHHQKYNDARKKAPLFPSCMSFINAEINGKKYCFIALSAIGSVSDELYERLKVFVKNYNGQDTEFILLEGDVTNFNVLTQHVASNPDRSAFKECSEKYYASCLTKLYLQHGSQLKVTGVVNGGFYPYEINGIYGEKTDSKGQYGDESVIHPIFKMNDLQLSDERMLMFRPCCSDCQKNKQCMFNIWKAAQHYGDALLAGPKLVEEERKKIMTSPLIHSFGFESESSLLQRNSMFNREEFTPTEVMLDEALTEIERNSEKGLNVFS